MWAAVDSGQSSLGVLGSKSVFFFNLKLYFSLWKEQRYKKWETLAPAPELAFEVGGAYLDMF